MDEVELLRQQVASLQHQSNMAVLGAHEATAFGHYTAADAEIKALKAQIVAEQQEGRFEEMAETSEKLARATYQRDYWAGQHSNVKGRREYEAAQPANPVERFIAGNRRELSDTDAEFIRQELPEYATDAAVRNRAMGAHYSALGSGIQHRSREYYQYIKSQARPGGGGERVTREDRDQVNRSIMTEMANRSNWGAPESWKAPTPEEVRETRVHWESSPAAERIRQSYEEGSGSLRGRNW